MHKTLTFLLDDWLEYLTRVKGWPGQSVAVRQHGKLLYSNAFGVADLKTAERLTPKHLVRFASHSKTFTAAAILKLVDRGVIKLATPIWPLLDAPAPRDRRLLKVTVEQLLSHTSGLMRDGSDCSFWVGRRDFPDGVSLLEDVARAPLTFAPGRRFKYSNVGYALLGLVIARLTGGSYEDFCVNELGVKDLDARPETHVLTAKYKFANGYSAPLPLYDGRRVVYPFHQATHAEAAATGWCGTPEAFSRWFSRLLVEKKILAPARFASMVRPRADTSRLSRTSRYALGLQVMRLGKRTVIGHSGGFPSHLSWTLAEPRTGVVISWAASETWDGGIDMLQFRNGVFSVVDHALDPRNNTPRVRGYVGRIETVSRTFSLWPARGGLIAPTLRNLNPLEGAAHLRQICGGHFVCRMDDGYQNDGEPVVVERKGGRLTAVTWAGFRYVNGVASGAHLEKI